MKKAGKATRPFKNDINKIPYDYTEEETNRFKEWALIDSAWRTMDRDLWIFTGNSDQDPPQDKEMQKSKMIEEALQIAEEREVKGKGEKERYTHLNAQFQRIARRVKLRS